MAHEFREYAPDQAFLMPPSPRDWLPEDHLAYQVLDVVSLLDMRPFLSGYSTDGRGAPAYPPKMLTTLLLYGWCLHVYSSRKLEALCRNDVGARVIVAGHEPDHRSINLFRLRHGEALSDLFEQSVRLCERTGMVGMVNLAIDGSKIEASASKRKAMSYGRMVEEEGRLKAEIAGYLQRAQEEDAAEDVLFGPDEAGPKLPDELRRRKSRLAKICEAKAVLEAEAQAAAEAAEKARADKEAQSDKPLVGRKPNIDPAPKDSAQRSFTDPDSRIMKGADGAFLQAYNAQAAVDEKNQVILACGLTQNANDKRMLTPMVEQAIAQMGAKPDAVLADPGYYSEENVAAMDAMGVKALIPPDKERCGTPTNPAPTMSEEAFALLTTKEKMRYLISTTEGRDAYRRRKGIVEPVFGQIKGSAGNPGYLGFLRRGLTKCAEEWHWVCARHNIMKYIRFKTAQNSPPRPEKRTRSARRGSDCAYRTLQMPI